MSDVLAKVEARGKERYVRELFGRIASKYDRTSTLLSLGLLPLWRRRLLSRLPALSEAARLLDVATGTGVVALAIARRSQGRPLRVVGLDFCRPMLAVAQRRAAAVQNGTAPAWIEGDALALPFADHSFELVTMSFALRNLTLPAQGVAELVRVLQPGGSLMMMDIARPTAAWIRWPYELFTRRLAPLLDRSSKGRGEGAGGLDRYQYIAESHRYVSAAAEQLEALGRLGLVELEAEGLMGGMVMLLCGRKPQGERP